MTTSGVRYWDSASPPVPGRQLEVGIEYPDGLHASSGTEAMSSYYEAFHEGRELPQPSGPLVQPQRGGGGGKRTQDGTGRGPLLDH